MQKKPNLFWIALSYVLAVPFYMLMWYGEHVDGVEPKSGQRRFKHKTVNGHQFYKQEGLKNIFKPWKPVPKVNRFGDMDVNGLYPSIMI